jgi:fructosamine-3-kinase
MKGNVAMRDLKFMINYARLMPTAEKFPSILGSSKEIFEAVAKRTKEELDRGEGALIHGDFWSGKYSFD